MLDKNSRESRRAYARQYRKNNLEAAKAKLKANRSKLKEEVQALKEQKGCMDCKNFFPYYVLDFDHRDGVEKVDKLSQLVNSLDRKRVFLEIDKCDVVCANCHRERTQQRRKTIRPGIFGGAC